jgi:hypothetical protein
MRSGCVLSDQTDAGRLLHISFTLRGNGKLIRVISARTMHRKERLMPDAGLLQVAALCSETLHRDWYYVRCRSQRNGLWMVTPSTSRPWLISSESSSRQPSARAAATIAASQ